MSEENLAVLRRGVELLNQGADIEAAVTELYHPDVEVRDLQPPPDIPEVVRGRAEAIAMLEKWTELFEDWSVEVLEYIEIDTWIACAILWRGTGKGSDAEVEWRVADAYEFEEGMIVRAIQNFADLSEAAEAARGGGRYT
jgi:ketosteroid isomerase-like protein